MLGTIFGPLSSGFISELFGWRAVFLMYFVLFLLTSSMLFLITFRAKKTIYDRVQSKVWEFKSQLQLLKDPWVRVVLITVFIEGALFHGCHAFAGTYLQERFGLTVATTGCLLAAFGVGAILYTLFVEKLVKILGQHGLVLSGGGLMFFCFIAMPLMPGWQYCGVIVFLSGFGFFMFHNTLQTCSSEMAPSKRGIALCLHGFSMLMGTSLGVVFSAFLIQFSGFLSAYTFSAVGLIILGIFFKNSLTKRNDKFEDSLDF